MRLKGKFTQIPDNWWQLCGKYPVVNKDTGEILKDSKGKDRYINVSHTYVVLIAKVSSFNFVQPAETGDLGYRIGKCTASNGYFASFLNVSTGTIKNMLSDMYTLGWLKSYEQKEGNTTTKRFLYVNFDVIQEIISQKESHQTMTTSPNDDQNSDDEDDETTPNDAISEAGHQMITGVVTKSLPPSHDMITNQSPNGEPYNKEKDNIKKINNIGFAETSDKSDISPQLMPQPSASSNKSSSKKELFGGAFGKKIEHVDKATEKMIDGSVLHPALTGEKFPESIVKDIEQDESVLANLLSLYDVVSIPTEYEDDIFSGLEL